MQSSAKLFCIVFVQVKTVSKTDFYLEFHSVCLASKSVLRTTLSSMTNSVNHKSWLAVQSRQLQQINGFSAPIRLKITKLLKVKFLLFLLQ